MQVKRGGSQRLFACFKIRSKHFSMTKNFEIFKVVHSACDEKHSMHANAQRLGKQADRAANRSTFSSSEEDFETCEWSYTSHELQKLRKHSPQRPKAWQCALQVQKTTRDRLSGKLQGAHDQACQPASQALANVLVVRPHCQIHHYCKSKLARD